MTDSSESQHSMSMRYIIHAAILISKIKTKHFISKYTSSGLALKTEIKKNLVYFHAEITNYGGKKSL